MNSRNKAPARTTLHAAVSSLREEMPLLSRTATLICLGLVCLTACMLTVRPRTVSDSIASWDGTNQNSGFLGYRPDGSGEISSYARSRYNELVAIYGSRFIPPLRGDAGISPMSGTNTYRIDEQHLEDFMTMNRWHKSGKGALQ